MALAWRWPSIPPVPWAMARSQFLTCTLGWASPRSWRTASIILVMPPRLAGWLLHRPPPSVLKGSLPTPEIKLPSMTNLPPSPLAQKPRSSSWIRTVMVKLSYIDAYFISLGFMPASAKAILPDFWPAE